jgi:hypothetical protein
MHNRLIDDPPVKLNVPGNGMVNGNGEADAGYLVRDIEYLVGC